MRTARYISNWFEENSRDGRYLFRLSDIKALCPELSYGAFKTVLSRLESNNVITRICRGIYAYKKAAFEDGLILFHTAYLLRANEFNYISLETILSEEGVISQIPINWITIMTSGRSNKIDCGQFGTIEFIHTSRKPKKFISELRYDQARSLWKASVRLAFKDMQITKRNLDLIDPEALNELI